MKQQFGIVRTLRIVILLVALVAVGGEAWLVAQRTTDWDAPLWVTVYPINADGRPATSRYIASLDETDFERIEAFFAQQAEDHGLALAKPFTLRLGEEVKSEPPRPPGNDSMLKVMLWSLQMRYWAWRRSSEQDGPPADIRLFVNYFDPEVHSRLDHSLGLRKGMIGLVNAFAARRYAGQNNVVIAHEMLHTVGASDKYDMATNQPRYPDGYAEPDLRPRYPQRLAELMGGRIPVSPADSRIPPRLALTRIGPGTAAEINWISP